MDKLEPWVYFLSIKPTEYKRWDDIPVREWEIEIVKEARKYYFYKIWERVKKMDKQYMNKYRNITKVTRE